MSLPLPEDAALELLELCCRPGQHIDDQSIADPLEAVDAGPDRGRTYENVEVAIDEGIQPALVVAGVKARAPAGSLQRVAKDAVDAMHILRVDQRLALHVGENRRESRPCKDLLQRQRRTALA